MDIFILQIAIIFVPGMIWERIDALFALKGTPSQFDIVRRSFVFGLVAYILTYGFYVLLGWPFYFLRIDKDQPILNENLFGEIAFATGIATLCGVFYIYIVNYKVLYRVMRSIKVSKRYGNEDVWDYTFSSWDADVEYIHIRDFEKKVTYAGWVELYSESDKTRELVLRDVIVYDFDGNQLFETARVYLARKVDNIDIEFPYREQPGERT
jgi:Family of unknown function (DUF6338)